MEVKWIKLSSDLFDNRKIKQIRKMPDGDAIIVIWFQILCLAGNQGSKGLVFFANDIPYTEEMLAVEFDRNINTVRLAMNTFIKFGMIEIVDNFILISNWEKYQSVDKIESIREYNREKKREQRLKQKETVIQLSQGQCQGQVIDCQDIDILSNSNSSISIKSLSLKEEEKKNKREVFVKPNIDEVKLYISENSFVINAEEFYDYYESNGWLVGKNKMKNWKSTVNNWNRKAEKNNYTKKEETSNPFIKRLKEIEKNERKASFDDTFNS